MIPLAPAAVAVPVMVTAFQTLYGISSAINDFVNRHIEEMTQSENPTISRTGRVLEGAKCGFGLGYISSVVIIATGQMILGNNLAAMATVATAATLTNPIAMTCAATGAILYGWNAMTDQERNELIEKLSNGLDVGTELIKSIIRFVIEKMKQLLDSKNLGEIKELVRKTAKEFGKTLGDITGKVKDKVHDTYDKVIEKTDKAREKIAETTSDTYQKISNGGATVKEKTGAMIDKAAEVTSETCDKLNKSTKKAVDGARDTLHMNTKNKGGKTE